MAALSDQQAIQLPWKTCTRYTQAVEIRIFEILHGLRCGWVGLSLSDAGWGFLGRFCQVLWVWFGSGRARQSGEGWRRHEPFVVRCERVGFREVICTA